MVALHAPQQNHLLAALPVAASASWVDRLQLVPLRLGDMLYEPGSQLQHVYFPTTAVVSLHYVMESGHSSEMSSVGNEGLVGVSLFMGGGSTPSSAVVNTAGHAYRMDRQLLKQEFDRAGSLQHLFLRYTQSLMTQLAQMAACNRHHSIEQQLCRWLLLTIDRIPEDELVVTQELIASLLGVRREGITQAAGKLQQAGYIRYRRGHVSVLDRLGLEDRSCECYAVVRDETARLLPRSRPEPASH